jgi:preprotein translocase subunit SecA
MDIRLGDEVKERGLLGISTYLDEYEASDLQFRARVGRDGEAGLWEGYWSVEDAAVVKYSKDLLPMGKNVLS